MTQKHMSVMQKAMMFWTVMAKKSILHLENFFQELNKQLIPKLQSKKKLKHLTNIFTNIMLIVAS